jgi:hypothetical protein
MPDPRRYRDRSWYRWVTLAKLAAPGPAITDGKPPPDNEDHDLQLEYQALPIGNT